MKLFNLAIIALLHWQGGSAFPFVKTAPHADNHAPLRNSLPKAWYQPDDHPVHSLFKRQSPGPPTDGVSYAAVGSPEWYGAYPPGVPDSLQLPQPWVDALNAAISEGKIPNIPQSQNVPGQNPTYPNGLDPSGPEVCSGTYKCRIDGDIWDAPTGSVGCGFDDGPVPGVSSLFILPFLSFVGFKSLIVFKVIGRTLSVPSAK